MSFEHGYKRFMVLWVGHFFVLIGSGLSSFGLSFWIFERTGSATPFAMSILSSLLPGVIFAPFLGSLADRMHRKNIIIGTTFLDLFVKIIMLILVSTKMLTVGLIYPIVFASATFHALQGTTINACIRSIVPEERLSQAHGLMQFSGSVQSMLAPIFAGAMYPLIGLSGLIGVNFAAFLLAIAIFFSMAVPQPSVDKSEASFFKTALIDLKYSLNYLREKTGLLTLIGSLGVLNFVVSLAMVLLAPLLLTNYDTQTFAIVETASGVAMVIGGLVAGLLPNINKKVRTMFLCTLFASFALSFTGVSPRWTFIAAGVFAFTLPIPYINSLLQSTVQLKIEHNALGRIGAIINALLKLISPIAVLLAGPLADKIFEPIMLPGGILGRTVIGELIGTGSGRGIGLIFMLAGSVLAVLCLVMLNNRTVLTIETRLPNYKVEGSSCGTDNKASLQAST